MKIAVIGSRSLNIKVFECYIPACASEIVSGGAKGVDSMAKRFAEEHNLKYTEFLPQYEKYSKAAPLKRNNEIIDYSDIIVALWDGKSRGTEYVINRCKKINKALIVFELKNIDNLNLAIVQEQSFFNLTSLSIEMLKEIIVCEINRENYVSIDTELIEKALSALLDVKRVEDVNEMKIILRSIKEQKKGL